MKKILLMSIFITNINGQNTTKECPNSEALAKICPPLAKGETCPKVDLNLTCTPDMFFQRALDTKTCDATVKLAFNRLVSDYSDACNYFKKIGDANKIFSNCQKYIGEKDIEKIPDECKDLMGSDLDKIQTTLRNFSDNYNALIKLLADSNCGDKKELKAPTTKILISDDYVELPCCYPFCKVNEAVIKMGNTADAWNKICDDKDAQKRIDEAKTLQSEAASSQTPLQIEIAIGTVVGFVGVPLFIEWLKGRKAKAKELSEKMDLKTRDLAKEAGYEKPIDFQKKLAEEKSDFYKDSSGQIYEVEIKEGIGNIKKPLSIAEEGKMPLMKKITNLEDIKVKFDWSNLSGKDFLAKIEETGGKFKISGVDADLLKAYTKDSGNLIKTDTGFIKFEKGAWKTLSEGEIAKLGDIKFKAPKLEFEGIAKEAKLISTEGKEIEQMLRLEKLVK